MKTWMYWALAAVAVGGAAYYLYYYKKKANLESVSTESEAVKTGA